MEVLLAVVVGALYAAGFYLMLRRSLVKLVIGLLLLGHAANLLIFTMGRLTPGSPPLIPPEATQPAPPFADPLPQALILTAIVIGFGMQAFTLVLIQQTYRLLRLEDGDAWAQAERIEEGSP